MASSARIDELQKKFDENPKRYFAPLANEFRKAGDLEQAIALCRAFLPQQPAHMSGHIVFGQALFEAKQHDEARTVFETALSLDPENLIALRYLGDIARETGDIGAAASWYRRVLDADPRNEEIAAIVAALPAGGPAAPETALSADGSAPIPVELPESQPAAAAPAPAPPSADAGPLAMRESLEMPAIPEPTSAPAEEIERSHELDLSILGVDAPTDSAPPPSADRAAPDQAFTGTGPANEMGFEVMEFVPPDRSDEPTRPSGFQEVDPGEGDAATPAAFVTETMAELYLQQGFHQEALNVYQQLLAQNPNDRGLRERVEQLASGARSSVGAASVSDAVIESAQRRRTATSVRTIRTFLASLAARRVVRSPDSDGDEVAVEMQSVADDAGPADGASEWGESDARDARNEDAFILPPEPADRDADHPERASLAPEEEPYEESSSDTELPWIAPPTDDDARPADAERYAAPPEPPPHAEAPRPEAPRPEAPRTARLSGEMGSVNELFAATPVAPEDVAAAEALAGAFLAPEPSIAPAARAVAGRPSHAAATELSLDNVFREPGQRTSSEQRRSAFSFDQFFSEGGGGERGGTSDGSEEHSPDDIAQFNAWLEGLKKK